LQYVSLEQYMQIKTVLMKALVYLRNVLLVDLAVILFVAFTFVFTGNFTFMSFSERIFWAGLGFTLAAGLVAFGAMFSGRSFGIPTIIRKPEEAKKLLDHLQIGDFQVEVEKRHNVSIQLFVIGLGCIAISALVQTLLG